jgi:hypothetical protein
MIPSQPLAPLDADQRSASDMGIRPALLNRHARTMLFCNGPFVVNPSRSSLRRFTLLSVVGAEAQWAAT